MPVWLLTGVTGFLGRHVFDILAKRTGIQVVVLGRNRPAGEMDSPFIEVDIEGMGLTDVIAEVRPDVVIHAAGRTPPGDAQGLYSANTLATLNLLSALRATDRGVRVVLAGSAAELGAVPTAALPVGEDYPCRPTEPYGISKWLAGRAGLLERPPMEVMVGRVFNPIGPGQPAKQAFGAFAARLARGEDGAILVGDVEARRDFIDVRDAARALVALADRGRAGEVYHIGTGASRRVEDGLEGLIRRSGRDVTLRVDPERPARGPSDSRADVRKIQRHTGWEPRYTWEESLNDLWEWARKA